MAKRERWDVLFSSEWVGGGCPWLAGWLTWSEFAWVGYFGLGLPEGMLMYGDRVGGGRRGGLWLG